MAAYDIRSLWHEMNLMHTSVVIGIRKMILWLCRYSSAGPSAKQYRQMMRQLAHVQAGRKFTREEMNQRTARNA